MLNSLSTFKFSDIRQISKNRYIRTISEGNHHIVQGLDPNYKKAFSRPRKNEILFSSFGTFLILEKYTDTVPHRLLIKKMTENSKPKISGVEYLPLVPHSERGLPNPYELPYFKHIR